MTPKRIHISEKMAKEYLCPESMFQNAYILESEHNRIVDDLKAELSTSNDLLKMTLEVSEFKTTEIDRLKAENEKLKFDLEYVSGVANDLLDCPKCKIHKSDESNKNK